VVQVEADLVFKPKARRLQGTYQEPSVDAPTPSPLPAWTLMSPEGAKAHILAGGSLLVEGWPGCGKTHTVREWVKDFPGRVFVIAKTQQACANWGQGCVTADHFVRKYVANGCCPCDLLIVEEASQINAYLWSSIVKCKMLGAAVVCLGDFRQLDAVQDRWAGCELSDGALETSDMLHDLCDGRRVRFLENKRSDPPLFKFVTGIWEMCLAKALGWARAEFPLLEGNADWTLCLSHARRIRANELALESLGSEARHGSLGDGPARVFQGMRLVGSAAPFKKGQIYTLTSVAPWKVDERLVSEATLKSLKAAYALTISSCQGRTLKGSVRILEGDHPRFGLKHLYVAASRACAAKDLQVA
jgi:hypothetical protein